MSFACAHKYGTCAAPAVPATCTVYYNRSHSSGSERWGWLTDGTVPSRPLLVRAPSNGACSPTLRESARNHSAQSSSLWGGLLAADSMQRGNAGMLRTRACRSRHPPRPPRPRVRVLPRPPPQAELPTWQQHAAQMPSTIDSPSLEKGGGGANTWSTQTRLRVLKSAFLPPPRFRLLGKASLLK